MKKSRREIANGRCIMTPRIGSTMVSLLAVASLVLADDLVEFTPSILVETRISQELQDNPPAGAIELDAAEVGVELVYDEKLVGAIVVEYADETAGIAEARTFFQATDVFSVTAGLFVNNFGGLETASLFDPLLIDHVETNVPGLQLDFTGSSLYGGVAIYQGLQNGNLKSFVPAIGVNINDVVDLKVSSRIEAVGSDVITDLSTVLTIAAGDALTLRGEMYSELNEKEEDAGKMFGFYGEIDFALTEKLTILGRVDQIVTDIDADKKSGQLMVHGGASYSVVEPLRVAVAVGANNEKVLDEDDWSPFIAAELQFEL